MLLRAGENATTEWGLRHYWVARVNAAVAPWFQNRARDNGCPVPTGNHSRLVIDTVQSNLADRMRWFLGIYTGRFNRRHQLVGHLFGELCKALIVDAQTPGSLLTVYEYVHLNPVRVKLIIPKDSLKSYRWSSFPECLKPAGKRWPWLPTDRLLGEMRLDPDKSSYRLRFKTEIESRRIQDQSPKERKSIRRGWYFGGETLKERLLSTADDDLVREHPRALREESETTRAERIVKEELKALGWKEEHLKRTRNRDPGKVRITRRLPKETTRRLTWVATRLEMGYGVAGRTCCEKLGGNGWKVSIVRNAPFVRDGLEKYRTMSRKGQEPDAIEVTKDGVIVDGHHRARVAAEMDAYVDVVVVDLNMEAGVPILDLPLR